MRVNISYSVKLEEVLSNLRLLFIRTEEPANNKIEELNKILKKEYVDEDIGIISEAIKEYRSVLASLDTKLAEMSNILNGYYTIKYGTVAQADQQEKNEIEQENE